ncbi:lamin tail domain-containing protein [Candidatus Saccharibacteria bacterium]|nr:lamin tail domain-containing protein [Candidatus Saccharibacteria bacterium]
MQKISGILALFTFSIFLLPLSQIKAESPSAASKLVISEIKLGDGSELTFPDGSKSREFVTLYNQSNEAISLSGWKLEYVKSDFSSQNCNAVSWPDTSVTRNLAGSINPGEYVTIKRSLNDGVDGSLRLIDSSSAVHDLVGWGVTSPCYETSRTVTPPDGSGKSLQRYLDCDIHIPVDTNINSQDFLMSSLPQTFVDNCPLDDDPPDKLPENPEENEGGLGSGPEINPSCEGVIINELLVNPSGSDGEKEFIEIFNPTNHSISLEGCKLQTSANSKIYQFSKIALPSGSYRSLYVPETGLTLANSSGGSVYLIDSDDTELQQINYPSNLEDDKSWSLIDGNWIETFSVTPDSINQLLALKPCPDGQFRNNETNRCNNIFLDAAGLTTCKPGQERNVETNRCRNIASLANSLKACAPDQYRNPETNRCKNINSANSLAACKEGQERNPETNRCRNVASLSSSDVDNEVKDVISKTSSSQVSWWLAAGSIVGAFIYGLWEWRNDVAIYLLGLRNKFSGGV